MTPVRCEAGGHCARRASLILVGISRMPKAVATCPSHVGRARVAACTLAETRTLVVVPAVPLAPPAPEVESCEWLVHTDRWPFIRRCPNPHTRHDRFGVLICDDHQRDRIPA